MSKKNRRFAEDSKNKCMFLRYRYNVVKKDEIPAYLLLAEDVSTESGTIKLSLRSSVKRFLLLSNTPLLLTDFTFPRSGGIHLPACAVFLNGYS